MRPGTSSRSGRGPAAFAAAVDGTTTDLRALGRIGRSQGP